MYIDMLLLENVFIIWPTKTDIFPVTYIKKMGYIHKAVQLWHKYVKDKVWRQILI